MRKHIAYHLLSLVLVLTGLCSCSKGTKNIDWNKKFDEAGTMGVAYREFISTKCLGKCQWSRISSSTLAFTGFIGEESFEEFERAIDDNVAEIWLNSGGGMVSSALKIATEIQRRKINVVVKGFCISSCANYLFLAGERKTIEGIVGFHGSSQALRKKKPCEKLAEGKCKEGIGDNESENAFFQTVGVDEILFDVTQSVDKGMLTGMSVAYYAPSAKTLGMLGVKGIRGDQNSIFLEHMRRFHNLSGELEFAIATDPNPTILKHLKM